MSFNSTMKKNKENKDYIDKNKDVNKFKSITVREGSTKKKTIKTERAGN